MALLSFTWRYKQEVPNAIDFLLGEHWIAYTKLAIIALLDYWEFMAPFIGPIHLFLISKPIQQATS